jgi:hypothetical protein
MTMVSYGQQTRELTSALGHFSTFSVSQGTPIRLHPLCPRALRLLPSDWEIPHLLRPLPEQGNGQPLGLRAAIAVAAPVS